MLLAQGDAASIGDEVVPIAGGATGEIARAETQLNDQGGTVLHDAGLLLPIDIITTDTIGHAVLPGLQIDQIGRSTTFLVRRVLDRQAIRDDDDRFTHVLGFRTFVVAIENTIPVGIGGDTLAIDAALIVAILIELALRIIGYAFSGLWIANLALRTLDGRVVTFAVIT